MKLWYKTPARDWLEGLPIGTGRLAAMVLGGHKRERIALNHEWLWKGVYRNRDNDKNAHRLPAVRELLLSGWYAAGCQAANNAFAGGGGVSDQPCRVDAYQPAGDLYLEFNHDSVSEYRRELDLDSAGVSVSYQLKQGKLVREYIADLANDQLLIRVTQEGKPFDCVAWLDRIYDPDCELSFSTAADTLNMQGQIRQGTGFQVTADVWTQGGRMQVIDHRKLLLSGVTEAVFAINIGVTARGKTAAQECGERKPAFPVDWQALRQAHIQEYQRHYQSMQLDLMLEESALPTDERLRLVRQGAEDPGLMLLYFNYGRYLLSASSANATLPANLQGKWNEDLNPSWKADYHHDINLQMNYWLAEPAGMQAYVEALLQHIERLIPHGRKAAQDLYGCRGVWFPLQADAWGRATPESHGWAAWIGAAAWLAQHVWWHYEFGLDKAFLRERAYPFFKEVAAFYEDYLIADATGELQIVPSQSPENRFVGGGELPVSIGVSSAMDIQLIQQALGYAIRAAELLEQDQEQRKIWEGILRRLPKLQVGKHDQLQEWDQDFDEVEPSHRHLSHLIGVYPGDNLDPEQTPELWRAAEISLERRLAAGGGHTGWSRAWVACMFARLGRSEEAWRHLNHLLDYATDSLLDLHPPRIFQIDGNLGGTAAMLECLLQSYHNELHLLPALPKAWPDGRVRGLRARGGFILDITWRQGELVEVSIKSLHASSCVIAHAPEQFSLIDDAGQSVKYVKSGHRVSFTTTSGMGYVLTV